MYNKKLIIFVESYTSCTCGRYANTKLEVYSCDDCGLVIEMLQDKEIFLSRIVGYADLKFRFL